MEIPKYHETFNPILDVLRNGEKLHTKDLQRIVIEKFYSNLPEELLQEKTNSGEILINNRIASGKSYLKKGGYLCYPERGFVQITEKGLQQNSKLDLKTVVESEENFYQEEKTKQNPELEELKNASPQDLIDEGFNQIEFETKNNLLE